MSEVKVTEKLTLKEQKNRDILDAAKAEFLERGFDNVSMDAIADRACVSKRTLYNHFPSKEELFEVITQKLIEQAKGRMRVDYDPTKTLEQQIREIAHTHAELCQDEALISTVRMVLDGVLSTPESCRTAIHGAKWEQEPLIDWIKSAQADGKAVECDAKINAYLFRSMLDGMFFWPKVIANQELPEAMDQEKAINSAVKMFHDLVSA